MAYHPLVRARAVERYAEVGSTHRVAAELGVSREAVRTWVRSSHVRLRSHGGHRRGRPRQVAS